MCKVSFSREESARPSRKTLTIDKNKVRFAEKKKPRAETLGSSTHPVKTNHLRYHKKKKTEDRTNQT